MIPLALVRTGWGAAELVAPDAVAQGLFGVQLDSRSRVVARVLGVRHLAQAGLTLARPSTTVLTLGVGADALHAASMLAVAGVDRSDRRAALASAGVATAFVLAGTWQVLRRHGKNSSVLTSGAAPAHLVEVVAQTVGKALGGGVEQQPGPDGVPAADSRQRQPALTIMALAARAADGLAASSHRGTT